MTDQCDHEFIIFKRTWQTVDYARYQVLDHSYEAAVCKKCLKQIDPWDGKVPKE